MRKAISVAVSAAVLGTASSAFAENLLDLERFGEIVQIKVCAFEGDLHLVAYDMPTDTDVGRPWVALPQEAVALNNGAQYAVVGERSTRIHDRKGITYVGKDGAVHRVECTNVTWEIWDILSDAQSRIETSNQ